MLMANRFRGRIVSDNSFIPVVAELKTLFTYYLAFISVLYSLFYIIEPKLGLPTGTLGGTLCMLGLTSDS